MTKPQPRRFANARSLAAAAAVFLAASAVAPNVAIAQPADDPADLLQDFTFYVNIAQLDLAEANARAIIDSGITPREFVALVEDQVGMEERLERAYLRALRFDELETVAADLWSFYEQGLRERARDPDRIRENIELLAGNARQRRIGTERLRDASQYAIPELIEVLVQGQNPALESEVRSVIEAIGSDAVHPITTALPHLNPRIQETLALILGRIGSTTARPALYALEQQTTNADVRSAAQTAIERIDGSFDPSVEPAPLYRLLGQNVLSESGSYTAFPGERHQLLWEWEPRLGLVPTPIYTEVYHEARAMELAQNSLALDATDTNAVALWVKANFKRENEQPEDYENPAYPDTRRDASYYAVSAGNSPLQLILAQALEQRQTYIARRAIDALAQTAGAQTLLSTALGSQPLVDALSYPDRRTRYEAALTIAAAEPTVDFPDAQRVVPLLAGILRDADTRFALVISEDVDRQQEIRGALEGVGYTVLAPAESLDAARATLVEVPGLDLIVSDLDGDAAANAIENVRNAPRLRATPVLALVPRADLRTLSPQFSNDSLTDLARDGISTSQLQAAAEDLVALNTGEPIGQGEAIAYSIRALNALYDLAVSNNRTLDVSASSRALLRSLEETEGEIRFRVAEVLSYIDQENVQEAIMEAALDARDSDRVRMLSLVADSAKRFGNNLEDRQIRRLIDLADARDDSLATAAAALMGALGLPNDRIVPLILDDGGDNAMADRR